MAAFTGARDIGAFPAVIAGGQRPSSALCYWHKAITCPNRLSYAAGSSFSG